MKRCLFKKIYQISLRIVQVCAIWTKKISSWPSGSAGQSFTPDGGRERKHRVPSTRLFPFQASLTGRGRPSVLLTLPSSSLLLRLSSERVYPRGGGFSFASPHRWDRGCRHYLGTAHLRKLGSPALACRAKVPCQEIQAEVDWDSLRQRPLPSSFVQFLKQRHHSSYPQAPESRMLPWE